MSTKHSAEFKAKVALEAISIPAGELDAYADKNGLSKTEVLDWVTELKNNSSSIFADDSASGHGHHHAVGEDVNLKTEDEELAEAVEFGAHHDELNYKSLIGWSTFGTVLVIVIVVWLIQFSQDAYFDAQEQASFNSEDVDLQQLRAKDAETLSTFGVVDLEEGVYRIPIDKAIERIAED